MIFFLFEDYFAFSYVTCKLIPNHQGWYAKWKLSRIHVFTPFGTDLHVQSVLIDKNLCIGAQSEVYQECVVGWIISLTSSNLSSSPGFQAWVTSQQCGRKTPELEQESSSPFPVVEDQPDADVCTQGRPCRAWARPPPALSVSEEVPREHQGN